MRNLSRLSHFVTACHILSQHPYRPLSLGKITHAQLQQALGIDPEQAAHVPAWNLSATLGKAQKADTIRYLVREGLLVRDDFPDDVSQLMSGVWAGQRCVEQNETGVRPN